MRLWRGRGCELHGALDSIQHHRSFFACHPHGWIAQFPKLADVWNCKKHQQSEIWSGTNAFLRVFFFGCAICIGKFPLRSKIGRPETASSNDSAQECSQSVSSPTLETWWQWHQWHIQTCAQRLDVDCSPRFVGVASSTRRIVMLRRAAETRWFRCRFWMILMFLVDLNGVLMALVFCIF